LHNFGHEFEDKVAGYPERRIVHVHHLEVYGARWKTIEGGVVTWVVTW
jgi:hypothetical protein